MGKFGFLIALCFAIVVSGCSTKMALVKGQKNIDVSRESIALLSAKISNKVHPNYPLRLVGAFIRHPQAGLDLHKTTGAYKKEEEGFKEYWLSFKLEPGINTFEKIWAYYDSLLLTATSHAPLGLEANVKPNVVNYLGHLDIVLRNKKNDKEKSAPSLQFISAGIVGFYTGTFDYVVEDRFNEDMKTFISEYPALQKVKIEKSILPQWIRPENGSTK